MRSRKLIAGVLGMCASAVVGFASVAAAEADTRPASDADVAAVMQLRNLQSGRCLDGNVSLGVRTLTCNGTNHQRWNVVDTGAYNRLVHVQSGRCLDGSASQGLRLLACNGNAYQRWDLTTARIEHPQSGRCLDGSIGARLKACSTSNYQKWTR